MMCLRFVCHRFSVPAGTIVYFQGDKRKAGTPFYTQRRKNLVFAPIAVEN
jgi:hypothetical protein